MLSVRAIFIFSFVSVRKIKKEIMAKRSRTDDGTPLSIIQDELFEIQRRRRQVELQTPKGPPPDMPYYATVAPTNNNTSNFRSNETYDVEQPQENKSAPKKPVTTSVKKKPVTNPVQVGLQDPTDIQYEVPLVQERTSSETIRRVKTGLVLTLLLFVCLYVYPILSNVPDEKRVSALSTLSVAIGLGALGAALWPSTADTEIQK